MLSDTTLRKTRKLKTKFLKGSALFASTNGYFHGRTNVKQDVSLVRIIIITIESHSISTVQLYEVLQSFTLILSKYFRMFLGETFCKTFCKSIVKSVIAH